MTKVKEYLEMKKTIMKLAVLGLMILVGANALAQEVVGPVVATTVTTPAGELPMLVSKAGLRGQYLEYIKGGSIWIGGAGVDDSAQLNQVNVSKDADDYDCTKLMRAL